MRVSIVWDSVEKFVEFNKGKHPDLPAKLAYMKKIIKTTGDYFSRLQANTPETTNYSFLKECYGVPIPERFRQDQPVDLVLAMRPFNESSNWFAAAGACATSSEQDGRPVAGVIYLNFHHIRIKQLNYYYLPLIFIHEVMHILGVNYGTFQSRNVVGNINVGGKTRLAITSPRVVEYAKKHFGCDEVDGVMIEDDGGNGSKGSHWEKALLSSEVMNPMVAYPARISNFSIKLLEDLGWYKEATEDKLAAQDYVFHKGTGCGMVKNGQCNGEDKEYCSTAERSTADHCTVNLQGKANCHSNYFTDGCNYVAPRSTGLCTLASEGENYKKFAIESYGAHSRCFMAASNSGFAAACLRTRCENGKVQFQIKDDVITCEKEGEMNVDVDGFKGKIKCPSAEHMCKEVMDDRCPMDCSGHGYCMKGNQCQCMAGYTGSDCNTCTTCKKETNPFVTGYNIENTGGKGDDDNLPTDILELQRNYVFYNRSLKVNQDSIVTNQFWVDYNKKIIEVYPSFSEYATLRLADFELIQSQKQANLTKIQKIVGDLTESLKEGYLKNSLDKEWEAEDKRLKQDHKDKETKRKEKLKAWIRAYWLFNISKQNEKHQRMIIQHTADLEKCTTDECKATLQKKIDWFTNTIANFTKMKIFFNKQLELNEEKKFEMTPENLELEKNLLYYKSHYAKNQLGVADKTMTKDYQDLELEINPDLTDYSAERKAQLEILLENMDKHTKLLKNKEIEIEANIKEFYTGFDSEWEQRQKHIEELDKHIKDHNDVEIVRHIQNWINWASKHKKGLTENLNKKKTELNECKDDICTDKAQKIIDWIHKTIANMDKIIAFFEKYMERFMDKADIKLMEGEADIEDDDDVMKADKKNQYIDLMKSDKKKIRICTKRMQKKRICVSDHVKPISFEDDFEDDLEDDIDGGDMYEYGSEEDFLPHATN